MFSAIYKVQSLYIGTYLGKPTEGHFLHFFTIKILGNELMTELDLRTFMIAYELGF